jgi:hypothetical protein
MRRTPKAAAPKTVSYKLIQPDTDVGRVMYALLDALIEAHHAELREARIALAWCTSWKPDVDGRVTIGKCRKASDLDRELATWDFIVLLSRSFWQDLLVTDAQRSALLDHELCHASVKYDANGEPTRDERDRIVYRIRKHDIEEFTAVIDRHGCYKRDLEAFAAALRRSALAGFEPCARCRDSAPGWKAADGGLAVARCDCWLAWQARARGDAA